MDSDRMLCVIITLMFAVCYTECGAQADPAKQASSNQRTTPLPAERFDFVVAFPIKQRKELLADVTALLKAKDYKGLDELAANLRKEKSIFPAGLWHLDYFYEFVSASQNDADPQWEQQLSRLRDWVKARPNSITARLALANTTAEYGWKARSGSWASEVHENQWKLFHERLDKAHKLLLEAEKLKEKCPCWYGMMIEIGLGKGWDIKEEQRLLNESVKKQPKYLAVYMNMGTYLQPRWYGKTGDWQKFASASADKIGGAEGDKFYARMIWNQEWLAGNDYPANFHSGTLSWTRAKKGFHGLMEEYAGDWGPPSEFCSLCVMARDGKQAKELFAKLGNRVMLGVWKSAEKFKQAREWASTAN